MADDFVIEAFTLLAIAILTIACRIAARWITAGPKNFALDDYLMPVAGVVYALETGAAYCVSAWWHGLANNSMTAAQRAALSPQSEEYRLRVGGSKTQVLGWSLYTTLLWLLKTCMAVFYSRLTAGIYNMTRRIRLAYLFIAGTYLAVILSILLGCRPLRRNWQIYPDPGNYCQPAVSHIDVYVTVTLNVVTDVYLISIPFPILFKARLPWREKLELVVLFSGGLFVMAAGILRCVLIVTAGANGASQAGSWACRETFVAVIIGNLPMIYPVCRRMVKRAGTYWSSQSFNAKGGSTTTGLGGSGYPLSEGEHQSAHSQSRKKKFRHPLSLPDTQWTQLATVSDEQIMLAAVDAEGQRTGEEGGIHVVQELIITRN
ncbi:hypothetical protein ASPACDRAFT_125809 [Aspergillus aculeatus ATCC 16872]|uniref:Rhodopsin domain-containing protein n=1 Tax=Aspergillus aculeatus (strain ATCC 16872 / CBS 172.66 / WB 5094) TaxID=690307 RepID=A0A1L9WJB7_ASPA1|nr:uncharacterized protein ASPACDRAFT_125809 [Aspergillus aculeatus ATCC 16872]OJJ96245.1 hypothetical protein ASPACDRAFT_125809 [Aspergillus aculeatus ATCC 16872]